MQESHRAAGKSIPTLEGLTKYPTWSKGRCGGRGVKTPADPGESPVPRGSLGAWVLVATYGELGLQGLWG